MKENEYKYKEYNALTKRLLAEGHTADHHPDYVRVDVSPWEKKTLDNYYGGFTYERWWIYEQTFKTPCGLQCKGLQCHSSMSYMGIEWTFENDMATIHCPYEKKECMLKHKYLQNHGVLRYDCEVHMTDEEYCYEGSVEHILKLQDDEIRRQEVSFELQKNGRVCREHTKFNRDTLEWEMNYDPYYCGRRRCVGMCPVLGHELDKCSCTVKKQATENKRQTASTTLFRTKDQMTSIVEMCITGLSLRYFYPHLFETACLFGG